MMRANAVLSVFGLVLAAGGAVVFIGLSVAHAQALPGKVLPAASSPLVSSRPLNFDSAACSASLLSDQDSGVRQPAENT